MKEKIPQKLFNVSEGIIIVPKLLNAGFVIAGKRGKGIAMEIGRASCRERV